MPATISNTSTLLPPSKKFKQKNPPDPKIKGSEELKIKLPTDDGTERIKELNRQLRRACRQAGDNHSRAADGEPDRPAVRGGAPGQHRGGRAGGRDVSEDADEQKRSIR